MNSALYRGTLRHRRHSPVTHAFRQRMFMLYLDLAELPEVFDGFWCWSARRAALASFRRSDYFGDSTIPLDGAVRDFVATQLGARPTGPIRLLTHLRYFGYIQNPVSFYYGYAPDGTTLEWVMADITNTPWGERFAYVVPWQSGEPAHLDKQFHVSPFMPMDHRYRWRFTPPGAQLHVHMENLQHGDRIFDATLHLKRTPIGSKSLAASLLVYPWMTAAVVGGIYWNAFRLWLKGARSYPHPHGGRSDVVPPIAR